MRAQNVTLYSQLISRGGKMQKESRRCYVLACNGCPDTRHYCKLPHLQYLPAKQSKSTNNGTWNPNQAVVSWWCLAMVDYYSGFIEINLLQNSTTSKQIITHRKSQSSRHGTPDKLITDNGPQFYSNIFKQFSQDYRFQHQTSSPHYLY